MEVTDITRLYYFSGTRFGLENVEKRRLKISRLMQLNDPFEMASVDFATRDLRRGFQKLKEFYAEHIGLICFSKSYKNPVQWAHYADQHKGVCLGFDIPTSLCTPVNYIQERIKLETFVGPSDMELERLLSTLWGTKFSHWVYEEEVRLMLKLDQFYQDGGFYFHPMDERLKLRQVIVGCESKFSRGHVYDALGEKGTGVEVFKVRPAFKAFKIVRNKNSKLWK